MLNVQSTLFGDIQPVITRGLIIRQPWADMIMSGRKLWELRGSPTRVRGGIAIIAGGSCQLIGVCDLADVKGPLTDCEYNEAQTERGITTSITSQTVSTSAALSAP